MAYKPKVATVAEGGTGLSTITGLPYGKATTTSAIVPMWYGDGSDSTQTFDGSSVVLGLTPSGNVYTLTRDILLASSTINNGVTINAAGFHIYCNGTLTNNGTISANGNNGLDGPTATGGAAFTGSLGANTAGGNGATGNGGAGVSQSGALGGSSGAGGAGSSGSGGAAGTALAPSATNGAYKTIFTFIGNGIFGSGLQLKPGCGGGGGGGDTTHKGGGGGAGGGPLIINAYIIAGTGTISANGGNGGNGDPAGNCGGGGAGGGGYVLILSTSCSGNAVSGQTITVNAGNIGTKSGTGSNGNTGSAGTVYCVPG